MISILDDDVMEWDETFAVKITGDAVGGGISRVNVTIRDDDRKYTVPTQFQTPQVIL